ncbi:hypothetical protein [Dellaglioa algida]|uniref:hypothetical protein n=1 Tax=Dellaglioa algida TaxID=105612 RepID=UPI00071749E7|nr:hypothetical protein [Dellaglioa algida]MDK1718156.1 hypothetical protein [Dellaglioa algida]MDK1729075.1 hypothetical protein [Dellaglioa algida]MDK1741509.1 hypothetical protein [Dellaglioa algida]SOB49738.1 conserved hypothetical protein [Dellaglioa algida]
MNSSLLISELKINNKNVRWLAYEMSKRGVRVSSSALYKKLRGDSQFTVPEINEITKILNLGRDGMYRIFFGDFVS